MKKLFLFFLIIGISYSSHALNNKEFYVAPKIAVLTIKDPVKVHDLARKLIDLTTDKTIAGVILVVDCYGGSSSDFSVLHDHIKILSSKKPTVCLVVKAFSGGYLIASAASYIIVHSGSGVGSIGVCYFQKYDKSTVYECMGAGKYKEGTHLPPSQVSEESKLYLQARLDKDYQFFVQQVVANRSDHLSIDNQKDWAEAQTFIGSEAVEVGLVDEVGTFFTAESKVKELLHKKYPDLTFESVTFSRG